MIIVKKSNLYTLVTLVAILLVVGEMRFFFALSSVNLAADLKFKYEVESFIFASIIMTLAVYLFLIYFMRKSYNILRHLDRLIELSEYGKHDVSGHLRSMGKLGTKINYLIHNFKALSDMKSLKISSLSRINNLLIEQGRIPLFLMNRHGNIVNCNNLFLSEIQANRDNIIKHNVNDIFEGMDYEELFFDIEKDREGMAQKGVEVGVKNSRKRHRAHFHAIPNAENAISHILVVMNV